MDMVWMKLYRKELKVKSSSKERKKKRYRRYNKKSIYKNTREHRVITSYKKKKKKKRTNQATYKYIESKTRAKVNLILLTSNIIFLTTKNNKK